MFIFSIKADKKKICVVLAVILLAVTSVIVLTKFHNSVPTAECGGVKYTLSAGSNEERVSFFSQFGWKVDTEPVEIKDVVIPAKFNDVYLSYNNIQKEQGLDLEPYEGKTCRQWVYSVKNYPQSTNVRATILVLNNRVIGGDLSTTALDGFMTGFTGEQPSMDNSLDSMMASSTPSSVADKSGASSAAANKSKASSVAPNKSKASSAAANKSKASSAAANKSGVSSAIPTNAWPTD